MDPVGFVLFKVNNHNYTCPIPKLISESNTFLYIMRNNRNGYFKIGSSKNPKYREKTLQAEDPDITLLNVWECDKSVEKKVHDVYNYFRLRGEWFKFSDQQMLNVLKLINEILYPDVLEKIRQSEILPDQELINYFGFLPEQDYKHWYSMVIKSKTKMLENGDIVIITPGYPDEIIKD